MQKHAVLLSYVGTRYCGWQRQSTDSSPDASKEALPSIQSVVEAALARITGEDVSVVGSGRTDSGVHAVGQVAHFVLERKEWEPRILQRGLNSALPIEIRALAVEPVELDFHAQRSAEKKQYSYFFQQGACALPHLEPYSWWIHRRLDTEAMQRGLDFLRGEHDFKPFQASGAKPGPTVRRILEAEITRQPVPFPGVSYGTELVRVRVLGTGFLKQMVRGIAGTLLQVGEGRRPPEDFQRILSSGERSLVGPTAPARALWLEKVWYPQKPGKSALFSL